MQRSTLFRLLGLGLILGSAAAALLLLPVNDYLQQFLHWVRELGPWGPVVLAFIWIPACVLAIPGSLITLASGALFGVVPGIIAVSLGSTTGAAVAFLIGRFLARSWVERKVAGNPKFQVIGQAIAAQGFKIVLLLRLSPVFPFNLLNYALALTRVSFCDYVLASWVGMLPATILYVYLGSTLGSLAEVFAHKEKSTAEIAFLLAGLVMSVVVTVFITRLAKRALNQALDAERQPVGSRQ